MLPWVLRLRVFASRHRRQVIITLLVVGLVSIAGAGLVYASPPEDQVSERQNVQEVSASVNTSAVVIHNTSMYDRGTRLENEELYLREAAPVLTLSGEVVAPSESHVRQQLVVEYVVERDGSTVWTNSTPIVNASRSIEGESAVVHTQVNVSRIAGRITAIREDLGTAATVHANLRYTVGYDTGAYYGQLNATAPFQFTDRAYPIDDGLAAQLTLGTMRSVTHTQQPAYGLIAGLLVIGVFAMVVAGGLRWRDPATPDGSMELERMRYAEWISDGRLPLFSVDNVVPINSLGDLVNVGIDTNQRVIFDVEQNVFGIIDGDTLYWYAPDGRELFDRPAFEVGSSDAASEMSSPPRDPSRAGDFAVEREHIADGRGPRGEQFDFVQDADLDASDGSAVSDSAIMKSKFDWVTVKDDRE